MRSFGSLNGSTSLLRAAELTEKLFRKGHGNPRPCQPTKLGGRKNGMPVGINYKAESAYIVFSGRNKEATFLGAGTAGQCGQ